MVKLNNNSKKRLSKVNGFIGKPAMTYSDSDGLWVLALAAENFSTRPVRSTREDFITRRTRQRHGVVAPIV